MQDIKPDTSLYTEAADRLIAFGLVLKEEEGGALSECKLSPKEKWMAAGPAGRNLSGMTYNVINNGVDYRTKPKPRELWAVYSADGEQKTMGLEPQQDKKKVTDSWDRAYPHGAPHTFVRFVEQP